MKNGKRTKARKIERGGNGKESCPPNMPRASAKLCVGAIVAVRRRVLFGEGKEDLPIDAHDSVCDLRILTFTEKEVNRRNTACVVVSHPSAPGGVFYAAAGSTRLLKLPEMPEGDTSDEEDAAAAVTGDLEMLPSDDEREDEDVSDEEESPPSDAGDAEPEPAPSPHLKAKTGSTYEFNPVITALQIPSSVVRPPRHPPRWTSGRATLEFVSPHAIFTSLFPPDLLDRILAATSAKLVTKGKKPVNKEELLAVIAGVMMTSWDDESRPFQAFDKPVPPSSESQYVHQSAAGR